MHQPMEDDSQNDGGARPKRVSSSKQKKTSLFEQLKAGRKNKYEVGHLESVYDVVDEREYSKKVLERQDDDWIVDDDGCGYVEDGRDIFDDDMDEESIQKSKSSSSGSRKRSRDVSDGKSGGIRHMLASMPAKKKKEVDLKLDSDDILGEIIGEIESGNCQLNSTVPASRSMAKAVKKEQSAKDYLSSFSNSVTKKSQPNHKPADFPKPTPTFIEHDSLVNGRNKPFEKEESLLRIKDEPMEHEDDLPKPINDDPLETQTNEDPFETQVSVSQVTQRSQPEPEESSPITLDEPLLPATAETEKLSNEFGDWDANDGNSVKSEPVDDSNLPLASNDDGTKVFRFYYVDAHEETNQSGTVYLFGKVEIKPSVWKSCCVLVKNIERVVYLLPRKKKFNLKSKKEEDEEITLASVHEEFNSSISGKYGIMKYRAKNVTKKFAFGLRDVPYESEYLEVCYPATYPSLSKDLEGETFSRVFGTTSSFLELFLLRRSIKGPCFLNVDQASLATARISWCELEVLCTSPNSINVFRETKASAPPLVMVTLHPQTVYNAKAKQTEIVAVCCLIHQSVPINKPPEENFSHFTIITKPSDVPWPFDVNNAIADAKKAHKVNLMKLENERALLSYLLTRLHSINPDGIIGHDLSNFGIELIMNRVAHHKVKNWSWLGRLRRSIMPNAKWKSQVLKVALTGRILCDVKLSAQELISSRSYDLDTLCRNVLNFKDGKRTELTEDEFKFSYCSGQSLMASVRHLMNDSSYIFKIFTELSVLPLSVQITNIAGNVLSRTLLGGRSERNEYLLLHAFFLKGFIVPDKEFKKDTGSEGDGSTSKRKKAAFLGGLVLDPKIGFYDDLIALIDFNSLYPSIIQEFNICFTTIPIHEFDSNTDGSEDFEEHYQKYMPCDAEKGVLPVEIKKLVESRAQVKKLLNNPGLSSDLKMQYEIRQKALKLTANSMYGCLGFAHSRFYAKPLASMVTAKGRGILRDTKRLVENSSFEVIYGDTDSIMINTRSKEYNKAISVANTIKALVNKCYKEVKIDIDGVFKYMLLLKKKKYAAVAVSKSPNGDLQEKVEIKGLDIVRRDWSQLASEAGNMVIKVILSERSVDDKLDSIQNHLIKIKEDLHAGAVPLALLTITKQLTKRPEDYANKTTLPHVLVALRVNSTSSKKFKQGDTVPYVICKDGTENPATQRGYHVDEIKNNLSLQIDVDYYLAQQIHPVISRLIYPLEGVDAACIASYLGLDPSKYISRNGTEGDENESEGFLGINDSERYKDCEKFTFVCRNENCKTENVIETPLRKKENNVEIPCLEECVNPNCKVMPIEYLPFIQNCLHFKIRSFIKKYYEYWIVCRDPLCDYKTNNGPKLFERGDPICPKCKQSGLSFDYSGMRLYNQLSYYARMFDFDKIKTKLKFDKDTISSYKTLAGQVKTVLELNNYAFVELDLISFVHKKR